MISGRKYRGELNYFGYFTLQIFAVDKVGSGIRGMKHHPVVCMGCRNPSNSVITFT